MFTVSIIMPVFNEERTLENILELVSRQRFNSDQIQKEVLVIDNGSRDNSRTIIEKFCENNNEFRSIIIQNNVGKGAALKCGYSIGRGDIFIVQDGDLEYDPNDYEKLIAPIVTGETKFVLGVRENMENNSLWRIRNIRNERTYGFTLNVGGVILNTIINIMYGAKIIDQATMYKVLHRDLLDMIRLESNGFDLEVEMICKLLRKGIHPVQIPVTYKARSKKEGKKIRLIADGMSFLRVIFLYRFKPLRRL
jgi:glycosyltransferase involved in cell wall biosynthesis